MDPRVTPIRQLGSDYSLIDSLLYQAANYDSMQHIKHAICFLQNIAHLLVQYEFCQLYTQRAILVSFILLFGLRFDPLEIPIVCGMHGKHFFK